MQRLEVSGAVRPIYWSLGVKWLILCSHLRLGLPSGFFSSRFPTKTQYSRYTEYNMATLVHNKTIVDAVMALWLVLHELCSP